MAVAARGVGIHGGALQADGHNHDFRRLLIRTAAEAPSTHRLGKRCHQAHESAHVLVAGLPVPVEFVLDVPLELRCKIHERL